MVLTAQYTQSHGIGDGAGTNSYELAQCTHVLHVPQPAVRARHECMTVDVNNRRRLAERDVERPAVRDRLRVFDDGTTLPSLGTSYRLQIRDRDRPGSS